jgi:hypothetical protein
MSYKFLCHELFMTSGVVIFGLKESKLLLVDTILCRSLPVPNLMEIRSVILEINYIN